MEKISKTQEGETGDGITDYTMSVGEGLIKQLVSQAITDALKGSLKQEAEDKQNRRNAY